MHFGIADIVCLIAIAGGIASVAGIISNQRGLSAPTSQDPVGPCARQCLSGGGSSSPASTCASRRQ